MKVALSSFGQARREHWGIECYHRALKQLCCAEEFFVRWKTAIRNHLFCALRAFVHLEVQRWRGEIKSWYALKRHLIDEAVTSFIQHRTRLHSA
jgi:hypothetical protein